MYIIISLLKLYEDPCRRTMSILMKASCCLQLTRHCFKLRTVEEGGGG